MNETDVVNPQLDYFLRPVYTELIRSENHYGHTSSQTGRSEIYEHCCFVFYNQLMF